MKAIYAFSGDPITNGHIDIIKRSSKMFEELYVAIGNNSEKIYTFSLDERFAMTQKVLTDFENIRVVKFTGLLVDYAVEQGIHLIIRGLRNNEDFIFEKNMFELNQQQERKVDTIFLPAQKIYSNISSSVVKNLQSDNASIHEYVPLLVKQKLEEKLSGQFIISITGEIGSGKNYLSDKFIDLANQNKLNVFHIDLDKLGHKILNELQDEFYKETRLKIITEFGHKVEDSDSFINRKELGEIVFSNYSKLEKLNKLMEEALMIQIRTSLRDKQGLIILNGALIAESNLEYLSSNNVILLKVSEQEQSRRLKERGFTDEQIKRRVESQFNFDKKLQLFNETIQNSKHGRIWEFNNTSATDDDIKILFNEVCSYLEFAH